MQLTFSIPAKQLVQTDKSYVSLFSIILLFTALFHHAVFCFINTNIFNVSSSALVLTELTFIGTTSLFFLRNFKLNYLIILLFITANAFIIGIFQHGIDLKSIRNFIIPVLMIWLGSHYNHKIQVDTLVKWMAWSFLLFGLFELFFSETFQNLFNIINFQIAIGSASGGALEYSSSSFSPNGTRYGGRNFLSFLGDHRVSSLFLETVNTSNFCTLLVAWGLSKKSIKEGWQFYIIGLTVALLGDSRFGVTLIALMTILRLGLSINVLKLSSYFSPIFVLIVCFYFGWDYTEFKDNFETRLGSTGNFIMLFKPLEFFGLYDLRYNSFVDQGYARLLHYNGLILMLVLWISFCRLNVNKNSVIFKYLVAIIISTNLAISGDSIFAFKWAATMWFLLGTQIDGTNANIKKYNK